MITDRPPRTAIEKQEYERSDNLSTIQLPPPAALRQQAKLLETALKEDDRVSVRLACKAISKEFASAFGIPAAPIRILGARPVEVIEKSEFEFFGDYDPQTLRIRLWMRTAVQQKPTAFGTFLSTLCHELCHHLDCVGLDLPNTFHTRGFYQRAGLLYHHIRDTPVRTLVWVALKNGTYRIDWVKTMRK
jgi:hypothetical protein